MKEFMWLIRRELWENRGIWTVPSIVGGILVVVTTMTATFGDISINNASLFVHRHGDEARVLGEMLLFGFGTSLFLFMCLYSIFYLVDSLSTERKDRSILFWKSLPISDGATVLSKLVMAAAVIPLIFLVAADLTTLGVAIVLSLRGGSAFARVFFQPDLWLQLQVLWLYLIVVMAIWYLPVAGWLLMVSAWARRAVLMWAMLPPILLVLIGKWFMRSNLFAENFIDRLVGLAPRAFHNAADGVFTLHSKLDKDMPVVPRTVWEFIDPAQFFASLEVWVGVAVGAALVYAAIMLRRYRSE
jgi:ABC-2 type transport system permease protein